MVGRHANASQGRITFDGAVDVTVRGTVVGLPRSVLTLGFDEGIDEVALAWMLHTEKVKSKEPLRFHARARLEFADPESFRQLFVVEPTHSTLDRFVELGLVVRELLDADGHLRSICWAIGRLLHKL